MIKLRKEIIIKNISIVFLIFLFGLIVGYKKWFPVLILENAPAGAYHLKTLMGIGNTPPDWYCPIEPNKDTLGRFYKSNIDSSVSLYLISYIDEKKVNKIKLYNDDGVLINDWEIANSLTKYIKEHKNFTNPNLERIHTSGIALLSKNSLILNVVGNGIFCLKWDGTVKWAIPLNSHHSLSVDKDFNIWSCLYDKNEFKFDAKNFFTSPINDDHIFKIDSNGYFIKKWSITDLLLKNNYDGIVNQNKKDPDRYHLNDVEPYTLTNNNGFFKKGDVVVSLRNVNTIFVFNEKNDSIKWLCNGMFHNQHDPDFIDGENIILFDNQYANYETNKLQSRVVKINALTNSLQTIYGVTESQDFLSMTLGKQELTENGHLLVTMPYSGKAAKFSSKGKLLWSFTNYVENETYKSVVIEVHAVDKSIIKQ